MSRIDEWRRELRSVRDWRVLGLGSAWGAGDAGALGELLLERGRGGSAGAG